MLYRKPGWNRDFIFSFFVCAIFSSTQALAEQTCIPGVTRTAPDERFTDNGDGTVTDSGSGLMWYKCLVGEVGEGCSDGGSTSWMNWKDALEYAGAATESGYSDWRLPNIIELGSLIEYTCAEPSINSTYFSTVDISPVWSSTPVPSGTNLDGSPVVSQTTRTIRFSDGHTLSSDRAELLSVRLVRGGN